MEGNARANRSADPVLSSVSEFPLFLFSPESGIEDLLKELNDAANKVIGFKEHGAEWKDADRTLWLQQFSEVQHIQIVVFENGLTRLKNAMSDYLRFS